MVGHSDMLRSPVKTVIICCLVANILNARGLNIGSNGYTCSLVHENKAKNVLANPYKSHHPTETLQ